LIDDIDRQIIKHLQTDGRMPYSQLGQLIGLSDASARQRVNRLTERGVIDIVAVTDPTTLGLGIQAMLGIAVAGDARRIAVDIGACDEAVYVVLTTGRYDLLVEVVVADGDALLGLLAELNGITGVASIETIRYLALSKQTYDWGVGERDVGERDER
jgi:Lrp/AsnC family transcriptional regulator for asnA, asnC and gidA